MSTIFSTNGDDVKAGASTRATLYADAIDRIITGSNQADSTESFTIGSDTTPGILGISTADEVLGRWHSFLQTSTKELRSKSIEWEDRRRLNMEGPPLVGRSAAWQDAATFTVVDRVEALGLHDSVAGRCIESLVGTMSEMRICIAEAEDIFRPLALFGDGVEIEDLDEEERKIELLAEFSEFLPVLLSTQEITRRVDTLAVNMVRQLVGFQEHVTGGRDSKGTLLPMRPLLDLLGDLLMVPTIIDGLLLENKKLSRIYGTYTQIIKRAVDPDYVAAQMPEEAGGQLLEYLAKVECLVAGEAFEGCIGYASRELGESFCDSVALKEQLLAYFKERLKESESVTAGNNRNPPATLAKAELPAASLVPWVCTLCLFSCLLKPAKSVQKLLSEVIKTHKVSPLVVLHGRIAWCITDFLKAYVPDVLFEDGAMRDISDVETYRKRQAQRLDDSKGEYSFIKDMQRLQSDVQTWLASLGATGRALESGQVQIAVKEGKLTIVRGLTLALRVHASLEEYLVLHVRLEIPIPRSCLPYISLGFQLLKAIETAPSVPRWAEFSMLLQRRMALNIHAHLEDAHNQEVLATSQTASLVQTALNCTYRIVGGAPPDQMDWYFDVGALCLCMAGQSKFASAGKDAHWTELRIISRWWEQIGKICDTTWSYWVRVYFPSLLNDACLRGCSGVLGLPRLCCAFANPMEKLVPPSTKLGRRLLTDLRKDIKENVVDPLCLKIDQDLRLHAFGIMQSRLDTNCQKVAPSDVLTLLQLRPICLAHDVLVDIKDLIEKQLSKSFYDLTALAMHDAEAYTRMRSLAWERYGLSVMDSQLPSGSLDQGLDVIEVMRSIHLFAAQYSYSLHQQWFAQAANQGDAKLNVLTVEHMRNSIEIHGMGIINTSVNYTYTFMKRKLEIVVEFLTDESVKSLLLADAKWMLGEKANKGSYSWHRAMETLKFLHRLGATSDGTSYLDKLRQQVTQIGNALGYVRMLRTAGMRCVGGSLPYVEVGALERPGPNDASAELPRKPQDVDEDSDRQEDKDDSDNPHLKALFAKAANDAQCPQLVVQASEVADDTIQNVRQCFEQSTDYLNLLVKVFGERLRSEPDTAEGPRNPTTLFHILVPALSISYLYSIINGRDALKKRAVASTTTMKSNAMCFDDGFAVGVAFLLSVFGLESDFQTLHWFDAVVREQDAAAGPTLHQVTPEAGGVDGASSTKRRRENLQNQLGRLSCSLEAASSLFDRVAS